MRAKLLTIILSALMIAGCPKPPAAMTSIGNVAPPASAQVPAGSLVGQVDMAAFRIQATVAEIASGATLALIDSDTGYTLATTVSDANGKFSLTFSNGFEPQENHVYYLEAVKGLMAGTALPNRIGSPLARVRTIVSWQNDGWVSAASATPNNSIAITSTTTALSIIASLRSTTTRTVPMLQLIGSLPDPRDATSFTKAVAAGIPIASLQQVVGLVRFSLEERDQDPFRSVLLDVSDTNYNSFVLPNMPFTITFLTPTSAAVGEELFVAGDNFDPVPVNNTVTFTGSGNTRINAPVTNVSLDRSRLRVVVPSGATSGPISVQVGNLLLNGPIFTLASRDGHRVVDDSGNLYVANSAYGTLSKISPQGVTTPIVTGLTTPRGITLGTNGTLYVISGDTIRNYSTTGTLLGTTVGSGATGAWGLAFSPAGDLFVSIESANRISKVSGGSLVPVTTTGLSAPRGLSFGPDGLLYVANYGDDTVARVNPTTGATTTYKSGFSRPWSLAFDTFGAMYVTNNAGNSVYRVGTDDVVKPFASVQSPGGIDADPSGYLYVSDNTSNRVYRIDTSGLSSVLAEGVSYPKGIAAASDGTFYVANSQNHTVVRIATDGSVTTVARGFNDPTGVALDEARGHLYVSDLGDGSVTRVYLADGSFSTVLRNLAAPSGLAYDSNRLYVYQQSSSDGSTTYYRQPEVQEYDVTTSPMPLTRTLRSNLRNNFGIARDPGSGAIYVTLPQEKAITRIDPATGILKRVATNTAPNPEDVAVDASGKVYVACEGTSTADDAVQVYTWDATNKVLTLANTLTDASVDRPTAIAFDGSAVYFANTGTGAAGTGSVKKIDPGTLAVSAVATGLTGPTGLAFAGTTMWVAHGPRLSSIATYTSTPAAPSLAFTWGGTVYDVGVDATGTTLYLLTEGNIYTTNSAGTPYSTAARDWIWGGRRFTPDGSGNFYVTSNGGGIYQTVIPGGGNGRSARWFSWATLTHQSENWNPTIAVGSYGGNRYLVVPRGGAWDGVTSTMNLATGEETVALYGWDMSGPHGVAFDSSTGRSWAITYSAARALRTNAARTGYDLDKNLDSSHLGFGATFHGGYFYATLLSHHRIDRFDSAGNRETQPFGLGGPEL